MGTSPGFLYAILALAGALGMAGAFARPAKPDPWKAALATIPPLIMLALFYSLAFHMNRSLGKWPESIGEGGFSLPLAAHSTMATTYFGILLLLTIFGWPIGYVLSAAVPAFRSALFYLGLYGLSYSLCLGAMLLAPERFLSWWWD